MLGCGFCSFVVSISYQWRVSLFLFVHSELECRMVVVFEKGVAIQSDGIVSVTISGSENQSVSMVEIYCVRV